MPYERSNLPSIQRFLVGLITNRNPVDTPFSLQGLNTILHHDAMNDGLNVEVSAYNTAQRRPGWIANNISSAAIDVWQYKDLTGNINVFIDTGSHLRVNNTNVVTKTTSAPWVLQGVGDFLYATDGPDQVRIPNTAFTGAIPWGLKTPQTTPTVTLQSLGYYNAVTGFCPATDNLGGILTITDPSNYRTLTITINAATVHFNVQYTNNPITTNAAYTTVTSETVVTGPPKVTTDVVTTTSSFQDLITQAGFANVVMNYYPNTGLSTLDFDVDYTPGALTMSALETIINDAAAVSWSSDAVNVPASAAAQLNVFMTATLVSGLYHNPGQLPITTQTGKAMNLTYFALYGAINAQNAAIQINSGLYSATNPQLPLQAAIGIAPRVYQYVSPVVSTGDTFSGTLEIQTVGASTVTHSFTISNRTLAQIAVDIEAASYQTTYIQNGTDCYMILQSFAYAGSVSSPPTQDSVVVMTTNTLVDLADTNLNFQTWTFLESNDYSQLPQQGVKVAYAVRDISSDGLSNVSPSFSVVPQIYPCRWQVALTLPSALYSTNFNLEVYRTVDGGSSFLYEQTLERLNSTNFLTQHTILDDGLNTQLIGPIDEENDPPPTGLLGVVSHANHLWGYVGNKVYFSGGPDTANGNGDESWPPGNFFQVPGVIISLRSTDAGLIVALTDDLHVVTGVDSSSFYVKPWLVGFGISNANAWTQDGSSLFVYTTTQQLHQISPNGAREIGFDIGDKLYALFPAATSNLTFHRASALDTALYISNGTDSIFRYNTASNQRSWSPIQVPLVPAGRVKSVEISTGTTALLNATSSGVWQRSLNTFSDNGAAYSAFFTVGVIQLALQGMRAKLNNIGIQAQAVGTIPQVWLLLNEINDNFVPFLRLFNPVQDPVNAPTSQSLFSYRYYIQSTNAPFPPGFDLTNLASVKIVFAVEAAKNEILGIFLRDTI